MSRITPYCRQVYAEIVCLGSLGAGNRENKGKTMKVCKRQKPKTNARKTKLQNACLQEWFRSNDD